jgi:hypothetical protein
MAGFVDHLRAEIEALERSLESDPRFVKLRELQRVRILYESRPGTVSPDSPSLRDREERIPHRRPPTREMSPATKLVIDAAREYVAPRDPVPVPLRELYREITEVRSIPIGGSQPINNLSAMLYRYGFEAVGRVGWRLRQPEKTSIEPSESEEKGEPDKTGLFCTPRPNGTAQEIHGAATL